ncbi:double strand break repair protein MRE11A [Echinococcus multilocularis]|uniref:Double-strand break repair protein n=1 Tax=Echinococcus multilocularis TaxID=6211 RepID=A0A087VZ35_ECHMU|nr:double strand break repair protein MRE11A [Echinococcus multilocularis]
MEKDGIRGSDTFKTLEEILCLGQGHKVDFILQGGDLFHEVRPSIRCLNEVLRLCRTHCLDESPVQFELLSNPALIFANTSYPGVNYLDSNLNIGLPIFAIHGNHDDPSGFGSVCPPDLLHTCGFINLFGKFDNVEELEVSPLLFRKGSTNLAIYGIGAIREERLHRLFRDNKVTFLRPDQGEWFSIAVIHQNRVRHGPTGYLPENFLPSFLDLVPEWNGTGNFYVIQPGSSVATSLSEGEAVEKFVFEEVVLKDELSEVDVNSPDVGLRVEQLCTARIQAAINQAVVVTAESRQQERVVKAEEGASEAMIFKQPSEPLVRLRVDTSGGFERFSALRFGQKFVGLVANPKDLITFTTKRDDATCRGTAVNSTAFSQPGTGLNSATERGGFSVNDVEFFISRYFASNSKLQLELLTEVEMATALRHFVIGADNEAIHTTVAKMMAQTRGHLAEVRCGEEEIVPEVMRFANIRRKAEVDNKTASGGPPMHESTPSAPVIDAGSVKTESIEEAISDTSASTRRRLKRITNPFVAASSDESPGETEDQMLLNIIEEVSGDGGNAFRTSCDRPTSSAHSVSEKQTSTVRGRGRGRRGLGGKAPRRGFGLTRRAAAAIPEISDTEAICIDSGESNDFGGISFDFRRKRGRRR